jgi:hypothetical protein
MKYRIGSKTGNLVRVLAVVAIVLMSALTALVSLEGVALADADSPTYVLSASAFAYDGADYNDVTAFYDARTGDVVGGLGLLWYMAGGNDIDCGLYYGVYEGDDTYVTVFYEHGQKGAVDALAPSYNLSCDAYAEGLFVTTDGVYAYGGDPMGWTVVAGEGGMISPTLEIYIPAPLSGNRSVFEIPPTSEGSWEWGAVTAMNNVEGEECPDWEASWVGGYLQYPMPMVLITTICGELLSGSGQGRALLSFNTSGIPEGAVITDAYLRAIPMMMVRYDEEDYTFVLGGTYNASVMPFPFDVEGEEPEPVYYSEAEFYGDFGDINYSDFPLIGEGNMNQSVYGDIAFNHDGLDYINMDGLTVLSLRVESDINYICPSPNGSVALAPFAYHIAGQPFYEYPQTLLVVDWYMPGEGGAGLVSPQIAVMMDIVAILFLTGFIIGLLFVIAKSEGMPLAAKAGVITTIAVMAVVGVIIIESLIVAFK